MKIGGNFKLRHTQTTHSWLRQENLYILLNRVDFEAGSVVGLQNLFLIKIRSIKLIDLEGKKSRILIIISVSPSMKYIQWSIFSSMRCL